MKFLTVPAGQYRIGTSVEGVDACVERWRNKLINPCYDVVSFREWIEKEFPAHAVQVDAFELQETPVRQSEVVEYLRDSGQSTPESFQTSSDGDIPVWGVSYEWAKHFADWLSERDPEFNYALPTETQWEVAARGFEYREFPYGQEFNPAAANTLESGIGEVTPVYKYADFPGPFGHLDLAGNVEEWVSSKYYTYEGGRLIEDNLFERFGLDYHPLRGGNFCCGGDLSRGARRHGPFPDPLFRFTGFRLVRSKAR